MIFRNNLENYNLHIADEDKDTITLFDDIIDFKDYQQEFQNLNIMMIQIDHW
jgi:hypothetical protein